MTLLDRFTETAKSFSAWCHSPPGGELDEARKALEFLRSLQAQAEWLQLQSEGDFDLDGQRCDDEQWRAVFERGACLPIQHYEVDAKPKKKKGKSKDASAPALGDLSDDIADVYRDLSEGLALHAQGHLCAAEHTFRQTYDIHWGEHARSACKVLSLWLAKQA